MGDYKGCGGLTREQFLYHETKTVAKLMADESLSDEEIVNRVVEENLFQFPSEGSGVFDSARGTRYSRVRP